MAWFDNQYVCADCFENWSSQWSCQCDDECPSCERSVSPSFSFDLSIAVNATREVNRWEVLVSQPTAEHSPDYLRVYLGDHGGALAFAHKERDNAKEI